MTGNGSLCMLSEQPVNHDAAWWSHCFRVFFKRMELPTVHKNPYITAGCCPGLSLRISIVSPPGFVIFLKKAKINLKIMIVHHFLCSFALLFLVLYWFCIGFALILHGLHWFFRQNGHFPKSPLLGDWPEFFDSGGVTPGIFCSWHLQTSYFGPGDIPNAKFQAKQLVPGRNFFFVAIMNYPSQIDKASHVWLVGNLTPIKVR